MLGFGQRERERVAMGDEVMTTAVLAPPPPPPLPVDEAMVDATAVSGDVKIEGHENGNVVVGVAEAVVEEGQEQPPVDENGTASLWFCLLNVGFLWPCYSVRRHPQCAFNSTQPPKLMVIFFGYFGCSLYLALEENLKAKVRERVCGRQLRLDRLSTRIHKSSSPLHALHRTDNPCGQNPLFNHTSNCVKTKSNRRCG